LEEASRDLLTCLDPLAGITGLDIMADVVVHAGPVEERVNGCIGSFDALVSGDGGVMVVVEDLCTKGAFGDAEAVLVIAEGPIRGETVMFQEGGRDSFVHRETLQGAEDWLEFRSLLDFGFELGGKLFWGEQGRDRVCLEVGATRDGIGYHVELAREVFDGGLIGLENFGPTSLTAGEVGLLVEVTEGGVVRENGEGPTFEVDSPFLEGVDDG
jgi:hypothetical protein